MYYTTLNDIAKHEPCATGWDMLLDGLDKEQEDDEELSFYRILQCNPIEDAIWTLRALGNPPVVRLFGADIVEAVLPLFMEKAVIDRRPLNAIREARNYARGASSAEQCQTASNRAWDASRDLISGAGSSRQDNRSARHVASAAYHVARTHNSNEDNFPFSFIDEVSSQALCARTQSIPLTDHYINAFEMRKEANRKESKFQEKLFREYFCQPE